MRTLLVRLLTVFLLLSPDTAGVAAPDEERLPADPALVTGTLPSGLTYIIRPHKNPEGRVSI